MKAGVRHVDPVDDEDGKRRRGRVDQDRREDQRGRRAQTRTMISSCYSTRMESRIARISATSWRGEPAVRSAVITKRVSATSRIQNSSR